MVAKERLGSKFKSLISSEQRREEEREIEIEESQIQIPFRFVFLAMDDCEKRNQETERFHLFDLSSEDDCLMASPSGRTLNLRTSRSTENQKEIDGFGLSDARNAQDGDKTADLIRQKELIPALSESTEPERTRNVSNCNLRKSLAWDSAFFTSAGVLDPEELSFITKGFSKAEAPLLPAIQEDLRRSAESNSTFDSDSLTLESIEIDLFEDIRASIQKSGKSSNVSSSRSNKGPVERGTQSLRSSKRIELPSQNMSKPVAASKRQSIGMQNLEKTTKKASQRSHVVQLASRSGEQNSSLKPPKILGRAVPLSAAPMKRTSLGASRIKVEHNTTKAVSGKGDPVVRSKKPGLGDSGSFTPRSSPSSKSSSSGSSPSFSSVNRSGGISSDCRGKSPANCSRNKTSSKTVNPASSGSTHVDPVRISSRTKIDSGNSHLSAYLVSMSKNYSSLSPASSIDGWSSESSSSTSVNQRSNNSKTSSSPRSGFSIDNDAPQSLDLQTHPHNQASFSYGSNGMELPSQCDVKSSVGTGALSHLAATNVSRSIKPSGLRMPSPKIGFFDAEKTALRSPRGGLQGARNCSPKDGPVISCLNRGAIKTKPGRTLLARTVTGTGKMKSESVHTGAMCPTSSLKLNFEELYEQANASPEVPYSTKKVENLHYKLSEVHKSPRSATYDHVKTCGTGSVPNSEVNGGLDALKNSIVAESAVQVSLKEDGSCISIGKENFFRIEDQADSLSKTFGFIDISTRMG
ncbi:uncharacterized protein LOC122082084 [Macadamia integrifolia]|uniref:uncharacterized protein LOC122082084 n=1 Tax=Macadamia integrifolia TaxID=60698 RepID=UPI001C4F4FBB|nr:uncharacterized protein LOC122082084 [Macadamia integrifolia]